MDIPLKMPQKTETGFWFAQSSFKIVLVNDDLSMMEAF
jgi:hypothetical protein